MPRIADDLRIFRSGRVDAANKDQPAQASQPNITLTLKQLLEPGKHFVIKAAPGAGKTSLLRYLTLQTLEEKDCLPVYIELKFLKDIDLRDVSGGLSEVLFRAAFQNNGELHFTADELKGLNDLFISELLAGKIVIFLDGLDEVPKSEVFADLANLTEGFARSDFRHNTLIVSSRPYALAQTRLEGFQELEIMPFDERKIYQFLNLYFRETQSVRKTKLLLNQHPQLLEMVRNPLLLTMIAGLMRDERDVGNSRLDLYRTITDDLVKKIDSTKRIRRFAFQIQDPNGSKKLDFLRQLAFDSLFGDESNIGENAKRRENLFC